MSQTQAILESWLDEAKSIAPPSAAAYTARRAEPRYDWHAPLELKVDGKVYYVSARDISQNGIGINARLALTDGTPVEVRRDPADPWIPAKVKRATQTVGGYKVGVGFELELDV